jgi:deglycase
MILTGKEIAILVDEGYEDLEFWVPRMRLEEAGAVTVVVGTKSDKRVMSKSGGLEAVTQLAAKDLDPDRFSAIVVPGGWAPDKLRRDKGVTDLVRGIHDQGKIVAMICHAGLVGISAGIVKGRRATGSMGIKDDLLNAGATWVDEAALREANLVWGRVVADIPAFCRELMAALEEQ